MKTIKLTIPIEAHGETLTELTLKELNTAAIIRCGMPVDIENVEGKQVTTVKTDVMSKYISVLAGIPISSVEKLDIKDFMTLINQVSDFFGVAMQDSVNS
jgi:hypothetical protein